MGVGATRLVRLGQVGSPDGARFGHVRDAVAVADCVGVFDVIAVVEVVGDAVLGGYAAHEDAWADVAELAVGGAGGAPEFSCVGKWVGGGVELYESVELCGGDVGELGFDPIFGVLCGLDIARHENCAFVCVIAKNSVQHLLRR